MKYKLTIYPALEAGNPFEIYIFETYPELMAAYHTCASLLLFIQDKAKVMDDYSNMFVCEKLVDSQWEELES